MKKTVLLYLLIACNMAYTQNAWRKIGDIAPEADNSGGAIAIDSNNVPYVAYADSGPWNSGIYYGTTVKKFNGTNWLLVGQRGISGPLITAAPEIAINRQNQPYVAYSAQPSGSNYTYYRLDKYNGTSWDMVSQASGTIGAWNAITIDRNNDPFIAFNSNMNTFAMSVSNLGTPGSSNNISSGYSPDFAVDNNNVTYMAYRGNFSNNYVIYVQRYNGANWEIVGPSSGISSALSDHPRITIDHNNVPYIVYTDVATYAMVVKKFNGTAWEDVGAPGFAGPIQYADIAIGNDNVPYVCYNDFLNFNNTNPHYLGLTVQKFNGTAWELVGQRTFSSSGAITIDAHIVIGKNNVPYVCTSARYGISWKAEAYYFGPPAFPPITLPVSLLNFEANAEHETVVINWSTATETNNDFFTIERSQDGVNFTPVARINAAGNSNSILQYTYTDAHPFTGRSFYRLKQTDLDGHYTYSNVRAVNIQHDQQVQVFPVNETGSFTITVTKPTRTMRMEIYDLAGVLLYKTSTVNQSNTISLQSQAKGLYFIKVMDGKEVVAVQKIIK